MIWESKQNNKKHFGMKLNFLEIGHKAIIINKVLAT